MTDPAGAVVPPSTGLLCFNDQALMIDAQLTTEMFGAIAPGLPREALALADLPIRTTAAGYAAHASQFCVLLHALAPLVDRAKPGREQVLWLVETARRLLPDVSKAAKVVDFVVGQYRSIANADDWERARDAIAVQFQSNAAANGYRYLEWYESPVNLATGVLALLCGEADLKRTIKIGTLSGWHSDNGTATMGGLLGFLLGTEGVRAQFPGRDVVRSLQHQPDAPWLRELHGRFARERHVRRHGPPASSPTASRWTTAGAIAVCRRATRTNSPTTRQRRSSWGCGRSRLPMR